MKPEAGLALRAVHGRSRREIHQSVRQQGSLQSRVVPESIPAKKPQRPGPANHAQNQEEKN